MTRQAVEHPLSKAPLDFSDSAPWWHSLAMFGAGLWLLGNAWHWSQLAAFGAGMFTVYLGGLTVAAMRADLREGLKARMTVVWWCGWAVIALAALAGWIWS